MKNVLIVQALVKQYRAPFFEQLYHALLDEKICLKVAYGAPTKNELAKGDNVELDSLYGVTVNNFWITDKLLLQPAFKQIWNADLIIVEQANKHLINYFLLALSFIGLKKVAFWGHGRNRQATSSGISEWIKHKLINCVDWWFAYTNGPADYLASNGVRRDRITNVQNSVNMEKISEELASVTTNDLARKRKELCIMPDAIIGLYCGGLYREKHLDVLLEAAHLIRCDVPEFELLIVGGGTEHGFVQHAAAENTWIHFLGPQFGYEKALCFRLADIVLNPGLVGLAILDAFTAGLPFVTTDIPIHSPEIDYLEPGINGMITPSDPKLFALAVSSLLRDKKRLEQLSLGALESSRRYSLAAMVENFKRGILACLTTTK